MRPHTSSFKNEISLLGRQITCYISYSKATVLRIENSANMLATEDLKELVTEQDMTPGTQAIETIEIPEEKIYSVDIIKNGSLLKSLMKQCNVEMKYDLNIGQIFDVKLGLLINNSYEYIDYGAFIVYSKEYNIENETWQYICYDKMLWAMKKYTRLNITYPITVKNYLTAIANKVGFSFLNSNFQNQDKLIYKDYFAGKDVTYRDILDKLAEVTGGNILVHYYGNFPIASESLCVAYPTETNDTIDETNLRDININFGQQFGPVNKIEAYDKENNLYTVVSDSTSIEQNGETKISITNNPFIFNGEEESICQNILNQLKNVTYSINDFSTTGICYYDYLDLFTVSVNNTNYKCLLLNNEIKLQQGIEESIFTDALENTQSETDNYVNVQNKETQSQISDLDNDKVSRSNVINAINQSKEMSIINSNRICFTKTVIDTTDSDGFIDTELDSDYVVICATASFTNTNYGFITPFYNYNGDSYQWFLKIEDINRNPVVNTAITATVYYFRK